MDTSKREELEEEFIKVVSVCSFCDASLLENKDSVKNSRLLECLHSVCGNCAASLGKDDSCCPKCFLQVHKSKLLEHKILEELVDSEDDPTTLRCSMHDKNMATHWCRECADYICERCIENHQQLKVTKDHVIVPKMEHWERRDKRQGSFPCSIHPSEQLVIFCTKCNVMTCRDCQLATHREHSYDFVEKIIDQAKMDIYDMYKFLTHHQMVLNQAQELIADRKSKILLRKQSLTREINIFSAALVEIINKRSQNLINKLEQMTANKVQLFETNSQVLRKHLLPFDHTIQFVKSVLHSSSDPTIIFSKDQILTHMKRIHYQKSTIPNVVRNLQLKFTSGDITNLMKELQSFGLISLNDEDPEGTVIENAASNLSKALRLALAKQFSVTNSNSAASQHNGQSINQSQHQQDTKGSIPTQSSQTPVAVAPALPRISSQVQKLYPRAMVAPIQPPPPPYPQRIIVSLRESSLPSSGNGAVLPPPLYPTVSSSSVRSGRPKISWHTPEPIQRPIIPTQSVTINKVWVPPGENNTKNLPSTNSNSTDVVKSQATPDDIIDLDALPNTY